MVVHQSPRADENDPRKVIVRKLALVVEGRDDVVLDLTGDISRLKEQVRRLNVFFAVACYVTPSHSLSRGG